MHTILIVDDDVAYRYAVRALLGRIEGKYEFLPDAINGRHALEIMRERSPDVIITDISMPEMNGVELIKAVKSSVPGIKILALSAYDDFAFVKDALKSGAEDYILKYEIEETDIGGMLDSICAKIDEERMERKSALAEELRRTLRGEFRDSAKAGEVLRGLFPGREVGPYAVAAIRPLAGGAVPPRTLEAAEGLTEENPRCFFVDLPERKAVAAVINLSAMEGNSAGEALDALARRIVNRFERASGPVCLGLSRVLAGTDDSADGFREAERLLERGFYLDSSRFFRAGSDREESSVPEDTASALRTKTAEILRSLEILDEENAARHTAEFFGLLRERKPGLDLLDEITAGLFAGLRLLLEKRKLDFADATGLDRRPVRIEDLASSEKELERKVSDCFRRFLETGKERPEIRRREVAAVVDFLRKNYRRDVELAEIAGSLGLSPNYLCNLFKKETGMRIFEYLNRVRIEEAIKLIGAANLKVYEIAERTGFRTASYFCRTFREVTGRSISEYRRSLD